MAIRVSFEPLSLRAFADSLAEKIGTPTGEPIRLDLLNYLQAIKAYALDRREELVPSLHSLERLSGTLHEVISEELEEPFYECLHNKCSPMIVLNLINRYFDNYNEKLCKQFLATNIQKYRLQDENWGYWIESPGVFFGSDPVKGIVSWIISKGLSLNDIRSFMGARESSKLYSDVYETLTKGDFFEEYVRKLSLHALLEALKDESLPEVLIRRIWDLSLPLFLQDALSLKKNNDLDHDLFVLAKRQLKPSKHPKWLALSKEARQAYKEWSMGHVLEGLFEGDTDNKRVLFWKQYLGKIDDIKEITLRGETAAVCMTIGSYDFVEFKTIGAIYVYPKGAVDIPRAVTSLDRDLKFREKVVRAGYGTPNGEGWIPHHGRIWMKRAQAMIRKALSP